MAEDEFAPDEWDPPQLSRHMPFPPPFIVDVDVFDSGPLLIFLLLAGQYYRGWHLTLPWWYGWVIGGIAAVWVVNVAIRPQKRRLFAWIPVLWRYFSLWLWAPMLMRPIPYRWAKGLYAGGKTGVLTFILNREEGRKRLANVSVDDDGVIDTTTGKKTGRLMRFIHWLFAIAMGQEPLVRLVWVSDTGSLDLLDPSAREGVWAARQELLARPDHRLALYLRVRPFPVRDIVVAAGPTGIAEDPELLEWAKGLVQRRLLMAVPAATRRVLGRRMLDLLGVGDQPGKLGRAGLYGRALDEDEVDALGVDAWGPDFRPMLAISPQRIEVETGGHDPEPIGDAFEQPAQAKAGLRRHRTYAITGLPDRLAVGWTEPLTGRSIHCDVAIHVEPIRDTWAESVLGLKAVWWRGLSMGAEKYALAQVQALRTVNMIRRRRSSALRVGVYATVAESQTPAAELALKEMVGRENFRVPALEQLEARMATEPTARDPLNQRFWTDSQTVAAAWPGTGGIWVEGCVLVGESTRSNEPVGWNPWWIGDETSVGVILGRSGSGKTNLEQALAGRMIQPHPDHWLAKRPPPVIVAYLKPYDEWEAFCRQFHGRHYRLTAENWRWALGDAPMDASVVAFNIVDLPDVEQVLFMTDLEHWVEAHQKPHRFKYPLLYIIGEAWAWAQDPQMAKHLQKYALQVRTLGIGLVVDTQRVRHLLETVAGDLLESASMFCLMRLKTSERAYLQDQVDIGDEGMRFLAQIAQPNTLAGGIAVVKGRGVIEAHGLRTTLQVRRFGFEAPLLDQTNPRLRDDAWFEDDDEGPDEFVPVPRTNGLVHHELVGAGIDGGD